LISAQAKEFSLALSAGQQLAFRLRANPTVTREGQRTGLYDDQARLSWLDRKAKESGFQPLMAMLTDEPAVRARKKAGGPNEAVFSAARFDGLLRVADAERLRLALESGIGAGKGFGFGLLTLARP
jgi:CRISPR system Cascade subunit CasE